MGRRPTTLTCPVNNADLCLAPARGKIREMNGIEGSSMNDCLVMGCPCTAPCALCQVLGEKHVRVRATAVLRRAVTH